VSKTLNQITDSQADAASPHRVDGPPVMPAKPEPHGKVMAADIGEPERELDAIQANTFKFIEPGKLVESGEGVYARGYADGRRGAEFAPGHAIVESIGNLESLGRAFSSVDGSKAEGDLIGVIEAEAKYLRQLQSDRWVEYATANPQGGGAKELPYMPTEQGDGKPSAASKIARNGNKRGR